MTEQTARKPDYYSDIATYGKFGEELFLKEYSDLYIEDVRKVEQWQRVDVDFIVNGKWLVEVKVDTVALSSNNLAFEVISHGSLGWSVLTNAHFVYMVLAKDDPLRPVKSLIIDMIAWREFCANRNINKKINKIESENIVDFLCPISELKKHHVIIKEKYYDRD